MNRSTIVSRPNFLIFCVDQMQSFALGCNGHPDVKTPNLDRLAEEGRTFRRAYCNNSVCMPARATMMSGLMPRQHGCITNGTRLPKDIPTLPQVLAANGWRTHSVGKLHLQPYHDPGSAEYREGWNSGDIQSLPENYYGFQSSDFLGGHVNYCFGDYCRWLEDQPNGRHEDYAWENSPQPCCGQSQAWTLNIAPELHYNDWIAQQTIRFMDDLPDDENFFLWCSFPDPHHPFAAAAPYRDLYDPAKLTLPASFEHAEEDVPSLADRRRQFAEQYDFDEAALRETMAQTYGMISHVDDCIGRVMDFLRDSGRIDNTVVVFLADHGEYLGAHHLLYKADWMIEEQVRVPMIWRVPGGVGAGLAADDLVSQIDLVPTLLDYAGLDASQFDMRSGSTFAEGTDEMCRKAAADPLTLPGRSLRPLLDDGAELPPESVLIEYDEDWFEGGFSRVRTVVTERFKLVLYTVRGGGQLFDLQNDPHEVSNLWKNPDYAAVKTDLMEQALCGFSRMDRLDQPRYCGA